MATLTGLAQTAVGAVGLVANPTKMVASGYYDNQLDPKKNTPYAVKIYQSNTEAVVGLMTNNLAIGVDAKWEATNLLEHITSNPFLSGFYEWYTMIAGASGKANPSNLGISTRKIYNNSGYLEFDLQFRVVDWKGTGEPVKASLVLSSHCLPRLISGSSATEVLRQFLTFAVDTGGNALDMAIQLFGKDAVEANKVETIFEKDLTKIKNIILGFIGNPSEGVSKLLPQVKPLLAMINNPEFFIDASAPKPVIVEVGTYFRHNDIIIESVKTEFSKQCTSSGPLYADFSLTCSSLQTIIMAKSKEDPNYVGLGLQKPRKKRVTRKSIATGLGETGGF